MSNIPLVQNAFVLHARPFKENQQLLELLTESAGKISALVYVGQSKRAIKKGMTQPFLPLTFTFKESHTALINITTIEATGNAYSLTKNKLYCGFYINELLVKLLINDIACDALFEQYQLTLLSLTENLPIAPQLRQFELSLLAELGQSFDFTPVFNEAGEDVIGFYYLPEQGFVPAYKYSMDHIKTPWFQTVHLQMIAEHIYDEQVLNHQGAAHTFKLLMRNVLNHLLDGKPLNSRQLFEKNS